MRFETLLKTVQEKSASFYEQSKDYAKFLKYVYGKKDGLYKEYKESTVSRSKIENVVDFLDRTDNWLKRTRNVSLRDIDESMKDKGAPFAGEIDVNLAQKTSRDAYKRREEAVGHRIKLGEFDSSSAVTAAVVGAVVATAVSDSSSSGGDSSVGF